MKDLHIRKAIQKQLEGRVTPISPAAVLADVPPAFFERGKFLLWLMCGGGYITQSHIKLLGPNGTTIGYVYKWNDPKMIWSERTEKWYPSKKRKVI